MSTLSRALVASAVGTALALSVGSGGGLSNRELEDIRRKRRADAAPPPPEARGPNLPGETNRQYAARMRDAAKAQGAEA